MNNERFGVPSASELARLVECANSHKAQAGIPDDKSKDSSFGDNVHAFLSGDKPWDELTPQEQQSAEACADAEQWHIDAWKEDGDMTVIRETRLGLTSYNTVLQTLEFPNADYLFTGKMDCLVIQGHRGLHIEFKSLHPDVEDPIDNAQIMGNIVLEAKHYNLTSIRGVIIAPFQARKPAVDYDVETIKRAEQGLKALLAKEEISTEADRKPGKWCKHCKAALTCKALKHGVLQSVELVNPAAIAGMPGEQQRSAMWSIAMNLPPEKHEAAYNGLAMIKRYVDVVESSFKARVEAGEMPGYVVQESPGNREVECAQKAYELLAPEGVTQEQVLACCKPSVTGLDEALRVASGVKSVTAKGAVKYNLTAREAKEKLEQILAPVMTRGKNKTKIVKVNQIEE